VFPEIDRTLITREQIASRVAELGERIAADLTHALHADGHHPHDEDRVVLVPIMTGAVVFVADLIRTMPVKFRIEVLGVSSYPGQTVRSKGAQLRSELPETMQGKHVLVIDDILDSGRTLSLVQTLILEQSPASLRTCVLLSKDVERAAIVTPDYQGFEIPDEFVVGYGLDYDGYYRNLPEIAVLRAGELSAETD
jgi:hypoxanthine phosphoribosyltransferase